VTCSPSNGCVASEASQRPRAAFQNKIANYKGVPLDGGAGKAHWAGIGDRSRRGHIGGGGARKSGTQERQVRSVKVLVGAWIAGGHGWPSYQGRVGDMATAQHGYHCNTHRSCPQVPLLEEREWVLRPGSQRITKFEHVFIHSLPSECSRGVTLCILGRLGQKCYP
jgi:hypothetical protein